MGGGGFAVGAGNPNQRQLIAGVIPKRGSQAASGRRHRIGHHQHRITRSRWFLLGRIRPDHRSGGPLLQGRTPKAAAIDALAGQAHEQGAGADAPGVAAEVRHHRVRQLLGNAQTGISDQEMQARCLRSHAAMEVVANEF